MMEQVNRTYRELCLELLKAWNRSEGGSYSDFGKAAEQIAKRIDVFVFESDSTSLQANAPDWRGLCEELLSIFDNYDDESNLVGIFDDMKANKIDLLDRAREALAQETEKADD